MNELRSNLIKAGSTAIGSPAIRAAHPCASPSHVEGARTPRQAPGIALIRDGDVVRAIEVTCPCGNTMVIECDYGEENGS